MSVAWSTRALSNCTDYATSDLLIEDLFIGSIDDNMSIPYRYISDIAVFCVEAKNATNIIGPPK